MKRREPARRARARAETNQHSLFDEPAPDDDPDFADRPGLGEIERDVNRMRLETSSNVYAQRRAYW